MSLIEAQATDQIIYSSELGLDESNKTTSIDLVENYRYLLRSTVYDLVLGNPRRVTSGAARLVLDVDGVVLGKVPQRIELLEKLNRLIGKAQSTPEADRSLYQASLAGWTYHPDVDYARLLQQNPHIRSLRDLLIEHPEFSDDNRLYDYYSKRISPRPELYSLFPPEPTSVDGNGWMVPRTLERLKDEFGVALELWCTGTPDKYTARMQKRLEDLGTPEGIPIMGRFNDIPRDHIQIWRAAIASLVAELVPDKLVFAVDNVRMMCEQITEFRRTGHPPFRNVIGLHYTTSPEDEYSFSWHNATEVMSHFISRHKELPLAV